MKTFLFLIATTLLTASSQQNSQRKLRTIDRNGLEKDTISTDFDKGDFDKIFDKDVPPPSE